MSLKISIDDDVVFDNTTIENTNFNLVQIATQIRYWAQGFFDSHPTITKIEIEKV